MTRVYLDWNATTPLRPEARAAMVSAMDVVGNPSSVHAEGRVAKGLVERARAQVAALAGCAPNQVVFTGSATEAAALAVAQKGACGGTFLALATEHDCFRTWSEADVPAMVGSDGASLHGSRWEEAVRPFVGGGGALVAVSAANSETGVLAPGGAVPVSAEPDPGAGGAARLALVSDITQLAGKRQVAFAGAGRPDFMVLSAHKMGGPKGVGALITFSDRDPEAIICGGGQEMGRRSGTENILGIAGFGAAAEAAQRDLDAGVWRGVEKLRNVLENTIAAGAEETIFVGKDAQRLPNTSCFITPGWKGETQVMQMDLAGFAISAGSACSSGKVRASTVLRAMGYSDAHAHCAVRVSLGPATTEDEVMRFCEAWLSKQRRHRSRAA